MKITIYALHLGLGGVENYLITLANMLSKDNDVTIISTYKTKEDPGFPISDKVKLIYLMNTEPSLQMVKQYYKEMKFLKAISKLFQNGIVLLKKYLLNIRIIKEDSADIIITSRIFHNKLVGKYASSNIVKIATEHNHHNNDMKYISSLSQSLENFNYLVPISINLTEFYKNKNGFNKLKVVHIPFYIDKQKHRSKLNKPHFTYVGRLSPEKGIVDLIETIKLIKEFQNDAVFSIIGDGIEMEMAKKMISVYNLSDSVTFHGYLTKEYVNRLLLNSSFLLLTSFTESFGIVLLEAMSFGVIPCAFDSAIGAVEVLDGFDCLLIKNRNRIKLAETVVTLYNDVEIKQSLSQKMVDRSLEYSYDVMYQTWCNLIRSVSTNERNS